MAARRPVTFPLKFDTFMPEFVTKTPPGDTAKQASQLCDWAELCRIGHFSSNTSPAGGICGRITTTMRRRRGGSQTAQ